MLTGQPADLNALYNGGHNQLVAMAKANRLCHEMCPDAKIGPAPNIDTAYAATCNPKDYLAAMNMDDLRNNMWIDPLVFGTYPKSSRGYWQRIPYPYPFALQGYLKSAPAAPAAPVGYRCRYASLVRRSLGSAWVQA